MKIIKNFNFLSTMSNLMLNCTKFDFHIRLGGSLQHSPDSLAVVKGDLVPRGGKGREREWKWRKGKLAQF